MKANDNKIDKKAIIDFSLLLLLLVSAILYVEYSTDLQHLINDLKYNSMAGLNEGIAVLTSNK